MKATISKNPPRESSAEAPDATAAFLIWGISPIYWKELHAVPPLEIVMHRVPWSPFSELQLLIWQKRSVRTGEELREPRAILALKSSNHSDFRQLACIHLGN